MQTVTTCSKLVTMLNKCTQVYTLKSVHLHDMTNSDHITVYARQIVMEEATNCFDSQANVL